MKKWLKEIWSDESGATDMVAIVVLTLLAIIFILLFRPYISALVLMIVNAIKSLFA